MKHFLVTGAAGFIGSSIADYLLNGGHKVTGLDNFDDFYPRDSKQANTQQALTSPNYKFVEGDINDRHLVDKLVAPVDMVLHIAAKAGVLPSINNPHDYIVNNISGTRTILESMASNQVKKLIFASSSSVYGNNSKIPFNEADPVDQPISPYAFTKRSCELMNFTYHSLSGLDIINLRFFTVYGPRQRPDLAIHKFTRMINEGKPITMYGDGETGRDYTFIDDIVSGVASATDYLFAHDHCYEIINLGNHHPVKLTDLISELEKAIGKKVLIEQLPKQPGDVDYTYADISKAKDLLGYEPRVSMEEGLKRFIDWYNES